MVMKWKLIPWNQHNHEATPRREEKNTMKNKNIEKRTQEMDEIEVILKWDRIYVESLFQLQLSTYQSSVMLFRDKVAWNVEKKKIEYYLNGGITITEYGMAKSSVIFS